MPDNAREIENLVYAYARRIDAGDLAGVAELFTHGRIQTGRDLVFEGAEAVRRMYDGSTRLYPDGTPHTRHLTTNVTVEVDEGAGTATAHSYYTVIQGTDELPLQPIIAGHYDDTFHRVSGRWWFDTREMFVDLTGDLSHHLLFTLNLDRSGGTT